MLYEFNEGVQDREHVNIVITTALGDIDDECVKSCGPMLSARLRAFGDMFGLGMRPEERHDWTDRVIGRRLYGVLK